MTDNNDYMHRIWFLDFETNKAGNIFLVGVLNSGKFRYVVLDSRLAGLAQHEQIELQTPIVFAKELIRQINAANGVLAAYSSHEKDVIRALFEDNGKVAPEFQYCNLHSAAKAWVKKSKRKEFEALPPLKKTGNLYEKKRHRYSLASIMRLLKINAPADYAIGQTTKRINAVIDGLSAKKGIYRDLTRTKKSQATRFLKHNEFDVMSLPILLDEISAENLSFFTKAGWSPSAPTHTRNLTLKGVGSPENNMPSKSVGEGRLLEKIREKSPQAYKRWDSDEEARLKNLFDNGWGVAEISKALKRQQGAVISRLLKLGLIDAESLGGQ